MERIGELLKDSKILYLEEFYSRINKQFKGAVSNLEKKGSPAADMLKKCKYSVFYTSPLNTLKEGPIYFLGLNPAGEPEIGFKEETLKYFNEKEINWCDYCDEKWVYKNRKLRKGEAKLQKNVQNILGYIQEKLVGDPNIRPIFSTNLFFFRSPHSDDLKKYEKENYDCWQYHEEFLKIVQPKIIVCNGNNEALSAYSVLKEHFLNDIENLQQKHLYGNYSLKSFILKTTFWGINNVLVIGIPHLSRYMPNKDIYQELSTIISKML